MRILVTGGAGYIGSHTLIEMLKDDHDVHVVDNFSNSSEEPLKRVQQLTNKPVTWTRADLRDHDSLNQTVRDFRPDAVIHFAGLKAVGESTQKPLDYYDVNVSGTVGLLRAMDSVGCKRIIFSSSATVYGEPVYLPYDEAHPENPTSVYGRTKQQAEHIIRDWASATPGSAAVLLRYFNPVGAHVSGDLGEDPQGIPNNLMPFVAQVAVGRRDKLTVFGNDYDTEDGTCIRDYIHVTDLASAHVAALRYALDSTGTELFNIGTGQGQSVLDMVHAFGRAIGRDIPYVVSGRRPGDIARMQADCSRAADLMGWRAQFGVDDMCASTWKWQSKNPEGYDA